MKQNLIALAVALALSAPAFAETNTPENLAPLGSEGYWFYKNKEHAPPPQVVTPPKAPATPPPQTIKDKEPPTPPKDPCQEEDTWTPDCGFVTPKSFSMQSKERDALLQGMVMNPGNPDAVKAVQKYTQWMIQQATYAAQVWKYNTLQDSSLNAQAKAPISQFGLQMANSLQRGKRADVWQQIKDYGGFLVLFTKESCDYCHSQQYAAQQMARDTGLTMYDASIEGKCLDGFTGDLCVSPDRATGPAQVLHVKTVPSIFLYMPDNTWIRVSVGLSDTASMEDRLYNFFIAWKIASTTGKQTGKTGMNLDPSVQPKDSQELQKLLSTPIKPLGDGGENGASKR